VVVFVENFLGVPQIGDVLTRCLPGERDHQVQVVVQHGDFRRAGRHPLQAIDVLEQAVLDGGGEFQPPDFLPQLVELAEMCLFPAELFLDHPHLFLQVELLLAAVDLLPDPLANTAIHVEDLDFALQHAGELFESLVHLEGFQYVLFVGHANAQIRGDDVGESPGVFHSPRRQVDLGWDFLIQLDVAIEEVDHPAHQGLELRRGLNVLVEQGDLDPEVRFGLQETLDHGTRGALDQDLDGVVRQLEHLHHVAHDPNPVEVRLARVLAVSPALSAEKNLLTLRHGRF